MPTSEEKFALVASLACYTAIITSNLVVVEEPYHVVLLLYNCNSFLSHEKDKRQTDREREKKEQVMTFNGVKVRQS